MDSNLQKRVIMFHQGADQYGSDKIFYITAREISKTHNLIVVLDQDGPLVGLIESLNIQQLIIRDLAVLRKTRFRNSMTAMHYAVDFPHVCSWVRKLIKDISPSFIYVNTLAVISPLLAAVKTKTPVIHHLHEIQYRPQFLFRLLYSVSSLCSDKVICVSKAVEDCFQSLALAGTGKTIVVHNGLPPAPVGDDHKAQLLQELKAVFPLSDNAPLIAYVARLNDWKGQMEFLEVVRRLRDDRDLIAYVAFFGDVYPGNEGLRLTLLQAAKDMRVSEQVHFFGYRRDAPVLLSIADVSIMGSVKPDPLPTVVLESMQQATPIVAYSHGGSVEMIVDGETGYLVEAADIGAMAEAVHSIISDPSMKRNFGNAAKRRFDEMFSEAAFLKRLKAALDSL